MPRMIKPYYAWIVVAVTFLALLTSAGVRTAPSVIIKPLETEFGWSRSSISLAVAVSLFAFGFGAPLGGTLIDKLGPRRVMVGGLALIALGLFPLIQMREMWQLYVLWGLVVGIGTGAVAGTLGATVAVRWFNKYRGLVIGLFGAATAAGQLIFVPSLIGIASSQNGWATAWKTALANYTHVLPHALVAAPSAYGWRTVMLVLAVATVIALVAAVLLMRNKPEELGLQAVGQASATTAQTNMRSTSLRDAVRTRDFWLLAGSFFVCGYTTNGLIQTHLLPHTLEHGFVENDIAGALAIMGTMNIIGTLASGWLSERFDNRKLLATYYGLRAMSLAALPFILEMQGMFLFAVIYGLDWVATVPPTVNLTAQRFGRGSLGSLYGWIFCSHMIGAGIASYAGGFFRDLLGDYHLIFISAAVMGIIAVGLSLTISSPARLRKFALQTSE
ncbi:MAG: MFS transporter [Chloroflexi bacterium]|nr:MFS transporter [Chloroflexota bacterium]